MKTKEKLIILAVILMMVVWGIVPNTAQAVLQSNGESPAKYNVNDWMINIRNMQTAGGTLGLTDTINEDLTSTNKNLDIHMEKNTEYGALAILSASAYGKPDKVNNGDTTTGNATGVVMKMDVIGNFCEWTAAGCADLDCQNFQKALGRYKNIYTTTYSESKKKGDAILDWNSIKSNSWINSKTNSGLLRTSDDSIFAYYGDSRYEGNIKKLECSRAVIVCGTNL